MPPSAQRPVPRAGRGPAEAATDGRTDGPRRLPALGHPVPAAVVAGGARGRLLAAQGPWEADPEVLGVPQLGLGLRDLWGSSQATGRPSPGRPRPPPPAPQGLAGRGSRTSFSRAPVGGFSGSTSLLQRCCSSGPGPWGFTLGFPQPWMTWGRPRGSGGARGHVWGTPPTPAVPSCPNLGREHVPVVLEGVDGLRQPHVHAAQDALGARGAPELVRDERRGVWHRREHRAHLARPRTAPPTSTRDRPATRTREHVCGGMCWWSTGPRVPRAGTRSHLTGVHVFTGAHAAPLPPACRYTPVHTRALACTRWCAHGAVHVRAGRPAVRRQCGVSSCTRRPALPHSGTCARWSIMRRTRAGTCTLGHSPGGRTGTAVPRGSLPSG